MPEEAFQALTTLTIPYRLQLQWVSRRLSDDLANGDVVLLMNICSLLHATL